MDTKYDAAVSHTGYSTRRLRMRRPDMLVLLLLDRPQSARSERASSQTLTDVTFNPTVRWPQQLIRLTGPVRRFHNSKFGMQ